MSETKRLKTIFYDWSADADRLLIMPEDHEAFREFKRWAYANLPRKGMYWDRIAEYYVIVALETVTDAKGRKRQVLRELMKSFDMVKGIKGASE
jgi:hypothetical protein